MDAAEFMESDGILLVGPAVDSFGQADGLVAPSPSFGETELMAPAPRALAPIPEAGVAMNIAPGTWHTWG